MAKKKENQLVFEVNKDELNIVLDKNKPKKRSAKISDHLEFTSAKGNGKFNWLKLDNAGTIYPSSKNEHWTFVYRLSAIFKSEIDPEILQKSLDEILPRFPAFNVYLRRGIFWYYFEKNQTNLKVEKEVEFPCSNIKTSNKAHLIRVLYHKNRLSLEVFHAVSDGHGSTMLFNSLIARYLENLGVKLSSYEGCLNYLDLPTEEELEDSFYANATQAKGKSHKEIRAYNIKGTVEAEGIVNVTHAVMSVANVKEVAKKFNTKLTVFLASVFSYEILRRRKNSRLPVKISIPIDMRKEFNSVTTRNFSTYINIPVKDETLSFEDVIEIIKNGLASVDRNFMQTNINSNVGLQKNIFIKLVPLSLKNIILNQSFNFLGEGLQTFAFSNLGAVKTPPEFSDYIERYEVNLGRSKHNSISVGLISFGDTLVVTISSKLAENTTERDCIRKLAELGVDVKVESNRREVYGG